MVEGIKTGASGIDKNLRAGDTGAPANEAGGKPETLPVKEKEDAVKVSSRETQATEVKSSRIEKREEQLNEVTANILATETANLIRTQPEALPAQTDRMDTTKIPDLTG